jgi:two-component system sensor histidine kinase HydH
MPAASLRDGSNSLADNAVNVNSTELPAEERERLQARSTELAQLAGGLAHEIRNPLSTIGMQLELLAEDVADADSPRARRMVKRISALQGECSRLEEVLNDFLQFAKAGELKLQEGSLNQEVAAYIAFLQPQADAAGVELRPHLDAALPAVRMDTGMIRQVLANLGRNALQAMPDGGSLDFLTHRDGERAILQVIDTGKGMTEATRQQMFDAFFSTRSGGSGLGLPTVRRIVQAHQGTISCESEPGKGTRFTINLPISPPASD